MSIHYGDVVSLAHPGAKTSISAKEKGVIHFTITGGSGVIKNGDIVSFEQQEPLYTLLATTEQWKITNKKGPTVHNGGHITLEAAGREPQQYLIYKVNTDPIEHVVLLMLENRSFFRVYGYMDPKRDTYVNYSESGKAYKSDLTYDLETPDPPHEIEYANISLEGDKPDGYIKAYEKYHKKHGTKITDDDLKDIMGYTEKGFLPALHQMEEFACICSQWYCSMRGPTWPNRMMALSGSSFNWRTTPEGMTMAAMSELKEFLGEWLAFKPVVPQRTSIFDILKDKNISCGVYTDTPFEFSLSADVFYPLARDEDTETFKKHAKAGKLPHFSFVEPNYIPLPNFGFIQNDDHPPANPLKAQEFITEIYESLRTSPKWDKTLLIITYDEHGGFFDPVVPPDAPVPDLVSTDDVKTFGKFGPRVPTVLVSPCVKHCIDDTVYDHTSVLKYVLEKWAPDCVDHLGARVSAANTLPVLQTPRSEPFPPIDMERFAKAKAIRDAKKPDPPALDHRLSVTDSSALAIEDPTIYAKLKAIIVEKRLGKNVEANTTVSSSQLEGETKDEENPIAHAIHVASEAVSDAVEAASDAVASAADAIASAISSFWSGGDEEEEQKEKEKGKAKATAAAGTVADNTVALIDAEQYAEHMLSLIKRRTDATTLKNEQESADLLANQLRAMSFKFEESAGDNQLAQLYVSLLGVRAKKHARQLISANKSV